MKFYTSNDISALLKTGAGEIFLEPGDRMTDIAKEIVQKHRIKVTFGTPPAEQVKIAEDERAAEAETHIPARLGPISQPQPFVPAPLAGVSAGAAVKRDFSAAAKPEFDLIIRNGTVVLPELGCIEANVCIRNGKVAALTTEKFNAAQEIDAKGLYVLPGIIDPHTHIGIFSSFDEEIVTETRSAILGGITTIGTFFNHTGSYLPTIDMLRKKVPAFSRVDMVPHFTLRDETQLAELPMYSGMGMNSYKVYMCGVPGIFPNQEDGFIVKAMKKLKELHADPLLCIHAENASIVDYATADMEAAGYRDLAGWGEAHPNLAEGEAVVRSAYFSKEIGLRTYIVHTSTKESIRELAKIKHEKLYVETTSPYLTLDTQSDAGVLGKMLPPFREPASRQALWEAIRAGLIDTIGTDNTTLTLQEKSASEGMMAAQAGYPAEATHLVSVLNEGFFKQEMKLEQLVPLMTMNPAKIYGIYPRKGTLMPGSDADVVLVDMNLSKTVDPAKLESRSDFSIFQGKVLRGWPCGTIKGGRIVAWNGQLTDDTGCGEVLRHCEK